MWTHAEGVDNDSPTSQSKCGKSNPKFQTRKQQREEEVRSHAMDDTMEDVVGEPKKRLMIREMVLENFKSYAGKQHVGPFHKV